MSFTNSHAFQIPIRQKSYILTVRTDRGTTIRRSESTESSLDKTVPSIGRNGDGGEIPSMDWLTGGLADMQRTDYDESNDPIASATKRPSDYMSDLSTTPYMEEHRAEADLGDVPIPTTGISVADEINKAQKDRFYTEVVPISGLAKGVLAAQVVTSATTGSFEPVRYLVRLERKDEETANAANDLSESKEQFIMIDVPPFSDKLVRQMQTLMGQTGYLSSILVTNRDCIHYDDSPSVFTIRRADLLKWEAAFPNVAIIAYRMDIPRDCREAITQRLDGYGPWAMVDTADATNVTFVETGRPLTRNEWDAETASDIMAGKRKPPGEDIESDRNIVTNKENGAVYSDANKVSLADSIRANEEGKKIMAVYTPGRTYGSMCYVFPELGLCASGFTLPLEDTRAEENEGMDRAGPALDSRGYITTSKAGITRQMESARNLVNDYADRFQIVLPSRGDPFYLKGGTSKRLETLLAIVNQYEKLGKIYEQLGIMGGSDDF
jgi:hypothetical protein